MRIRRLVALAAVAAAPALSACEGGPVSTDPAALLGGWAYRGAAVEVQTAQGPRQVRFVDQWVFDADLTFDHALFVIPAQTDELLGFIYVERGTFTLRGEKITIRSTEQFARTADPWSLQTTRIQSPGYASKGSWTITGDQLDLDFECHDTASCAPHTPYTRAPSTLD
jgi:hypothetical protein